MSFKIEVGGGVRMWRLQPPLDPYLFTAREEDVQKLLDMGEATLYYELNEMSKTVSKPVIPEFRNITENSVLVSWTLNSGQNLPITGYKIGLKNEDTGQEIISLNLPSQPAYYFFHNLNSGTNYSVSLIAINEIGNSIQQSKGFKTLGGSPVVIPPVVTPPVVIPPTITISAEVQAILTKFDNNDYTYPSWYNNNITWVKEGRLTSDQFLNAFNDLLQNGTIIDKTLVIPPIPELPPQLETESCQQYRTRVKNLGFSHEWLSPCPEIVPALPNKDSYDIKLTNASYMGTSKGKTVNIQTSINLTGTPVNSIHARLQITNRSTGIVIYMNFQNLSVGGGQTFPLVFNIADLGLDDLNENTGIGGTGKAVASIHYKILLWESLENPTSLTPFPLIGNLTYDSEVIRPNPITGEVEDKTSLLGKIMGVTALLGTLALLGSKGR